MSFRDLTNKLLDSAFSKFGEEQKVKYRPSTGGTFTIRGIFDEMWEEVDPDTGIKISTTQPNLGIKENELPFAPLTGDTVEVISEIFKVTDVQEDGQGASTLFLHRVKE